MFTERDYYNILHTAKADGIAEGKAEGLAEGEAKGRAEGKLEEKIRIAKALKKNGVADNIIASATGIPEQQIAALK